MPEKAETVTTLTHPEYDFRIQDWEKFSLVMEGGRIFVDEYLQKFSKRESTADFNRRSELTFSSAHAKSILVEIKNSIFQRMVDITRNDGPQSYQEAIKGENGGVNFQTDTMDSFIGNEVILSLLTYGKVGVFVDKPVQLQIPTRAKALDDHPYLYIYEAPSIRSWRYDDQNTLTHVLLHDFVDIVDDITGLVVGTEGRFRLMRLTDQGVEVRFFNQEGIALLNFDQSDTVILNLPRIPFVIGEISESLLQDIADYQIALLNLGSADINYAMKSNFPFYTEQYTAQSDLGGLIREAGNTGEDAEAQKSNTKEVGTGVTQGRRYPKGVDRPGFINPSPEPLKVSMEKQKELREEMRQLVNLALTSLRSRSAESKREDERGKEEGLSAIGMELETLERHIALIWNFYETRGNGEAAVVVYPKNYDIKSDEQRIKEADDLTDQIPKTPSTTLKKELSKESAETLVGHKVSAETMKKIYDEIDAAPVVATDPEVIRSDSEAGLVGKETASLARGYPEGEVEKANVDHIDRLTRIAEAQSDASTNRGIPDGQDDPDAVRKAREGESDPTTSETGADKTRGKGK